MLRVRKAERTTERQERESLTPHTRLRQYIAAGVVAIAVAVAALVTPNALAGSDRSDPDAQAQAAGTNGAAVPKLGWKQCAKTFRCTTAKVPMNYRNPHGKTIKLALLKRPADDQKHKIGTIFYNPGGPGVSGIGLVQQAADKLVSREALAKFDLVGFDPRGVSRSTPLRCFRTPKEEASVQQPAFPMKPEQSGAYLATAKRYTELCARNGGKMLSHMSTANVARDLDLLRAAVGDKKLTYYGTSYGTYLGAVYANMFPDRVRALALEGVVDPKAYQGDSIVGPALNSDGATQSTMNAFFRACDKAGQRTCALADGTAGGSQRKFDAIAERSRVKPIPVGDKAVGYPQLIQTTVDTLYTVRGWSPLATQLEGLYRQITNAPDKDQTTAGASGAAQLKQQAAPGGEQQDDPLRGALPPAVDNEDASHHGVVCADRNSPRSQADWPRMAAERDKATPGFGSYWTFDSAECATWPSKDQDRYTGDFDARTASPALIVNSRFDPNTDYESPSPSPAPCQGRSSSR